MDSASRAEMPCGGSRAVLLIEGFGGTPGEAEALSADSYEEIAAASGNHLASKAEALASHEGWSLALVAHIITVTSTGEYGSGFAHSCKMDAPRGLGLR